MTTMNERGKYIVIEGPNKIANVRQARMLVNHLSERDIASRFVHEPYALSSPNPAFHPHARAELLRLTGHRLEIFEEEIKPGLIAGEVVVTDGNWLSSLARQGIVRNLGVAAVRELTRMWLPSEYLNPHFLIMLSSHNTDDPDVQRGYDVIGPLAAPNQKSYGTFTTNFSYIPTTGSDEEIHERVVHKLNRAKII